MTKSTLQHPHAAFALAQYCANLADDKKAKDITVLDTQAVSSFSDYFVIASVDSRTQMVTLAETLQKSLRQLGCAPVSLDIDRSGHWSVLDFGDVVIHLLHESDRAFYQLERFWSHATEVPAPRWIHPIQQAS